MTRRVRVASPQTAYTRPQEPLFQGKYPSRKAGYRHKGDGGISGRRPYAACRYRRAGPIRLPPLSECRLFPTAGPTRPPALPDRRPYPSLNMRRGRKSRGRPPVNLPKPCTPAAQRCFTRPPGTSWLSTLSESVSESVSESISESVSESVSESRHLAEVPDRRQQLAPQPAPTPDPTRAPSPRQFPSRYPSRYPCQYPSRYRAALPPPAPRPARSRRRARVPRIPRRPRRPRRRACTRSSRPRAQIPVSEKVPSQCQRKYRARVRVSVRVHSQSVRRHCQYTDPSRCTRAGRLCLCKCLASVAIQMPGESGYTGAWREWLYRCLARVAIEVPGECGSTGAWRVWLYRWAIVRVPSRPVRIPACSRPRIRQPASAPGARNRVPPRPRAR